LKVILIAGKALSGKDTAAKMIEENLKQKKEKVLIIHFADLLKYICKQYFNWNGEKNNFGRDLLQYVGTNVIRKQRPDYWVDFVIDFLSMFKNQWDYVIIPDCRFPNEIDKWREGDWEIIAVKINRLNFKTPLTLEQQAHPSEVALDSYQNFDYVINSESGVENLSKAVNEFLKFLDNYN
jgi:hypothetical protein